VTSLDTFREVVLVDTEFEISPGNRPAPVCVVAHELKSGRWFRIFQNEFGPVPPYVTGSDVLFVAYYASAELGCYRVLGWPMPERILDLFVEFRARTNGLETPDGNSLLGALAYFGLDVTGADTKTEMQQAIGSGRWRGQYSPDSILDYCGRDVLALKRLLPAMLPKLDLPRALLRGRYMAAVARMEHAGTPIDTVMLDLFRRHWTTIQDRLIAEIDAGYRVFDGRTFKLDRFTAWLAAQGIPWPLLESGRPDLSDDTFRQQARAYPSVAPLRELRSSLADLRLNDLAVGTDGRNRTLLSPFRSRTGRNQPSNTRFIFGPSVWLRGLVKPLPGHGLAYIDWGSQEIGIAAALSGDTALQAAYLSGDPYLAFARQAGAVPADATKATHGVQREQFKQCALAVLFGMEAPALARRIAQPTIVGRDLLRAHRETYRRFWAWSDASLDRAMLLGLIHTVFGWPVRVGPNANPRSLRNFPMQSHGSEMLRIACCLGTERGVEICAPIHDAVLICAPVDRLEEDVSTMRAAMAEASRHVLAGFELTTDANVIRWPERYSDPRGRQMWQRVSDLVMMAEHSQCRGAEKWAKSS
jgi:hypothetical protein